MCVAETVIGSSIANRMAAGKYRFLTPEGFGEVKDSECKKRQSQAHFEKIVTDIHLPFTNRPLHPWPNCH